MVRLFCRFRKKFTVKCLLTVVLINILISLIVFHKREDVDVVFDIYYSKGGDKNALENEPLLSTLNTYRSLFLYDMKETRENTKAKNQRELVNPSLITVANNRKTPNDAGDDDHDDSSQYQLDNELFEWLKSTNNEVQSDALDITSEAVSDSVDSGSSNQLNDYLFNRNSFLNDMDQLKLINSKSNDVSSKLALASHTRFYEPKVILDNKQACSSRQNKIFIVCMIHSHRNNFIRRKTMRDTWLSQNKIQLFDLIQRTDQAAKLIPKEFQTLEMVHLFIIGSEPVRNQSARSNHSEATLKSIHEESDHFRDMIMIDTVDNYKNLVYKHMTAVNWIIEHCPQALYMVKLDDDVFVNIKPLSKHLVNKFGLNPVDYKFVYCSIVDKAKPVRHESKWSVGYDEYPFKYYPRYCEGFSYITNMATVRLMHQQAQIIPRFWIDDVYFTGLLLHGFDRIEWYNYRPVLKWSFYDFWDLGNSNSVLIKMYASALKLLNVRAVDYYRADFFVILHMQKNSKSEVNYELREINENTTSSQKRNDNNVMSSSAHNSARSRSDLCFNLNFFSMKNSTLVFNEISRCYKNEKYSFHFYNFCTQLWKDS